MAKTLPPLPGPVKRALTKLGQDIRHARLRRRIPLAVIAERALITQPTLIKVERGAPTVSMGAYATVLFVLGMNDALANVADVSQDTLGLGLEETRLPKRIRRPRPRPTETA